MSGMVVVTVTIDGVLFSDIVGVEFVEVTDVLGSGTNTIDCDNYDEWVGKNFVVVGGILMINSVSCAPM